MWHQYIGRATYSKPGLTVPRSLLSKGRTLWLVANRVHRQGTVVLTPGGTVGATHIGYLSPLEVDLTPMLRTAGTGPTVSVPLSIVINAEKEDGIDGLVGEIDLTTDGTGLGGWGGIGGHVRLESRPAAWITDPFVRTSVAPDLKTAGVNVSLTLAPLQPSASSAYSLSVAYFDPEGAPVPAPQSWPRVGSMAAQPCNATTCQSTQVTVDDPALWDPSHTAQFTARIVLQAGTTVLDVVEVKFGFKQLTIEGYHFKLNGRYLFLHGYGDDAIYPMSTVRHEHNSTRIAL